MAELDLSRYSTVPLFNTKAVVQETGVSAATLRAWERRYGVPEPDRTGSNYRLYSEREIALIRWLKDRVDAGLSISQAVELYRRMEDGESVKTTLPTMNRVGGNHNIPSFMESRKRLITAFINFDERDAEKILNELFALYTIEDVLSEVMQPAMVTIGDMWHNGEVGIPTEHFASAYVERKIMALINAQPANHDAPLIVTGCAPHEQHELGILLVSLFLRRTGLRVLYLGQNVPLVDLQAALETLRPAMLALSASSDESAAELVQIAEMLTEMAHPRPLFAYGGRAFAGNPHLADQIPYGIHLGGEDAQLAARTALRHIRRYLYERENEGRVTH
jgi:methanogenic corrinoid protein MtbC1